MSNLIPFQFESFQIRVIEDGGESRVVAKDVAEALGYVWQPNVIGHVPAEWKGISRINTPGGGQQMAVLSEQGLYFFLGRSDKPKALGFQKWIAGDVMPSIRKTGGYGTPQARSRTNEPSAIGIRDILLIGRDLKKIKGISDAVAMAVTLDTIQKNTGLDVSPMAKALPSVELNDIAKLNATEVGEPIGLKPRPTNLLLQDLGLQYRDEHKEWRLTEAGTAFGEMKPYHRNGHTGYEVRWKESVIPVLRSHVEQKESV